jgi:hypothetical protein
VCTAPYFPQHGLPPEEVRCPNCDAPAPPPEERPKARAVPVHEPQGRSRVVNIVALLHFVMAASGLFLFVGMSVVVGERGGDAVSALQILFGAGWAACWGAAGFGLLRRWKPAWYASIVLTGCCMALLLLSAARNPLGAVCNALLCVGILWVLIARQGEFR